MFKQAKQSATHSPILKQLKSLVASLEEAQFPIYFNILEEIKLLASTLKPANFREDNSVVVQVQAFVPILDASYRSLPEKFQNRETTLDEQNQRLLSLLKILMKEPISRQAHDSLLTCDGIKCDASIVNYQHIQDRPRLGL